ncbi:hypothetical protein N7540_001548 [Penicillium herquei]|nr:hypothetical protein N7540_001548 [Penicillium herquei]
MFCDETPNDPKEHRLMKKILADTPRDYLSLNRSGADGRKNSPLISIEDLICGDHIRNGIFIVYFGKTARRGRVVVVVTVDALGVGHCIVECGCCIRSRGFDLTDSQKAEVSEIIPIPNESYSPYTEQISRVSLWGLVKDIEENPLNLIEKSKDHPPSYDGITFQ